MFTRQRIIVFILLTGIVFLGNYSFVSSQSEDAGWAQVSVGQDYTMAVKNDRSLWAWGDNEYGQLGDGTQVDKAKPVKVMTDVSKVYADSCHTYIVKKDGTLWACGENSSGRLGDNSKVGKAFPVKVMDDVTQVDIGDSIFAVKKDGSLWTWPLYIESRDVLRGDTWCYEDFYEYKPSKIADNIALIEGNMFIKKDNSLWVITKKQLNNMQFEKLMDNVSMFSNSNDSNYQNTMVIKTDGTLWAWGANGDGQLGDGTNIDKAKPVKIMNDVKQVIAAGRRTEAVKKDGTLWFWGLIDTQFDCYPTTETKPVKVMDDVSKLVCDSMILKNDGSLWGWGSNFYGIIGTEPPKREINSLTKILEDVSTVTVASHAMAIKKDGSLWAWGSNSNGQIGCGITGEKTKPIKIMAGVKDIIADESVNESKYAIKDDGSLWAWGRAMYLGNGTDLNPNQIPEKIMDGVNAVERRYYADGDNSTSVIKSDGSLWACGANFYGQLGDGTIESRLNLVKIFDEGIKRVAPGCKCTFIIKEDDSLWSYGNNTSGQLGIGRIDWFKFEYLAKDRSSVVHTQALKILENVSDVFTHRSQTAAIKKDGSLFTWGLSYGYPGDGTKVDKNIPTKIMDNVSQVSLGFMNSTAIKQDGSLWSWGYGAGYRLGNGTEKTALKPIKIMDGVSKVVTLDRSTWAIKSDGSLWVWGDIGSKDGINRVGYGEDHIFIKKPQKIADDVSNIVIGEANWEYWHVLIIKKDGGLWGMGNNSRYQLGDGTSTFRSKPVKILDNVSQAGRQSALRNDGSLWTWGDNEQFQIGDGSEIITIPVQIKAN